MKLVIFEPAFGLRNVSPFCLKIEMLLTALDLPFTLVMDPDPRKAPKGKLPYLVDDGVKLPDSELICEYLDAQTQGRVYAGLTAAQRGQGLALARLCEDHLYWLMVGSRWLDDDWWPNVVSGFFSFIPWPLRGIAASGARRQVRQTLDYHGLGKHSLEEQKDFARRDFAALDSAIPAEGFLFSESPGVFDFTVASLLAGIFDQKPPTWINPIADEFPRLRDYAERVQQDVGIFGRPTA